MPRAAALPGVPRMPGAAALPQAIVLQAPRVAAVLLPVRLHIPTLRKGTAKAIQTAHLLRFELHAQDAPFTQTEAPRHFLIFSLPIALRPANAIPCADARFRACAITPKFISKVHIL